MSQNVLGATGSFSREPSPLPLPPACPLPLPSEVQAPQIDLVPALTRALWQDPASAEQAVRRRPFDAQYWACWLVATVFPLLMAYLLLTR